MFAVGLAVCCGVPVLASLGVLGAIAGLSFGNWVVIVVGIGAAGAGLSRWGHRVAQGKTASRSCAATSCAPCDDADNIPVHTEGTEGLWHDRDL